MTTIQYCWSARAIGACRWPGMARLRARCASAAWGSRCLPAGDFVPAPYMCVTRTRHRACIRSCWPPAGASACAVTRPNRHYAEAIPAPWPSEQRADPQFLGHGERDVFFTARQLIGAGGTPGLQLLDHTAHQYFRSGGARRDADTLDTVEPAALHVFGAVDQVRRCGHALGQLAQAVGVGTVRAADHQHYIAFVRQLLDRILAVLRGVADVILAGAANSRKPRAQGVDDAAGIVHGQGGLGDESQTIRVVYLQVGNVFFVFHQVDGAAVAGVVLAHGAFDLRVTGMADQDAFATVAAITGHLDVHLGHQRAGGIEHFKAT